MAAQRRALRRHAPPSTRPRARSGFPDLGLDAQRTSTGTSPETPDGPRLNECFGDLPGLAALLGNEPAELAAIGSSPSALPQHTVLVGIRNLDNQEKERIAESGVHVFTMKDIDRDGIAAVAERALALAADGTGGIHVSFDMDVCDPSIAPGVGTPVKGGLDYREAHMVMELVADSRRLVAFDLVEVNPTLDVRNATAEFATELALSALGKNIL